MLALAAYVLVSSGKQPLARFRDIPENLCVRCKSHFAQLFNGRGVFRQHSEHSIQSEHMVFRCDDGQTSALDSLRIVLEHADNGLEDLTVYIETLGAAEIMKVTKWPGNLGITSKGPEVAEKVLPAHDSMAF